MNLSFQKIFYALATAFALFAVLVLAKPILVPLVFALLLSFIIYPIAKKFESWGVKRILAAFLSIFSVMILLLGGIFLFSTQIVSLSSEFTQFQDKILQLFTDATIYFNKNLNFAQDLEKGELLEKIKAWFSKSLGTLVSTAFSSGAAFLAGFIATLIFTFLFLIYRDGLTDAFARFFHEKDRVKAVNMFKSVQKVGKSYLFGISLIMVILGFINSIGLLLIGIDNPFLFGFLAAVLAIIPYVGTTIGAAIPVMYAFMTYDSIWKAIAVFFLFWAVQVVESNFLSPKVVGGSLKVNALAAILSIIIGASVWGIAGMILFLPLTAMLRVVCENYEELKPIALLIGEQDATENKGTAKFKKMGTRVKSWFSK